MSYKSNNKYEQIQIYIPSFPTFGKDKSCIAENNTKYLKKFYGS